MMLQQMSVIPVCAHNATLFNQYQLLTITRQPKNARSKRELAKREPQITENPKTALLLRGTSCSSLINDLLTDLHALKRPYSIRFSKKNSIHPFEDATSLEFFSRKNDVSMLVFGSHSKKRPHALTFMRTFDSELLDMLELCVVHETARTLKQFRGEKCRSGVKPLLNFSGTQFESPTSNEYTLAKNLFIDFFRGAEVREIDVEGMQLLISFAVGEEDRDGGKPQIHMRCWRLITKRSGQRTPKVEVEEIGPRIDFRVGRMKMADDKRWKEALKKAKTTEAKPTKNIETDLIGDKVGRIHMGRQDLDELQTRKMKGLKRDRKMSEEIAIEGRDRNLENYDDTAGKRQRLEVE